MENKVKKILEKSNRTIQEIIRINGIGKIFLNQTIKDEGRPVSNIWYNEYLLNIERKGVVKYSCTEGKHFKTIDVIYPLREKLVPGAKTDTYSISVVKAERMLLDDEGNKRNEYVSTGDIIYICAIGWGRSIWEYFGKTVELAVKESIGDFYKEMLSNNESLGIYANRIDERTKSFMINQIEESNIRDAKNAEIILKNRCGGCEKMEKCAAGFTKSDAKGSDIEINRIIDLSNRCLMEENKWRKILIEQGIIKN